MKNKFTKIISSLLILAFLVSCLAIFASAEDDAAADNGEAVTEEDIELIVNRTFDEGWTAANGFGSKLNNNKSSIEYEETEDFDYNYYNRMEALNAEEFYFELKYGSYVATHGNTVFEIDLKIDDATNIGRAVYLRASGKNFPLIDIRNNQLYVIGPGEISYDSGDVKGAANYLVGSLAEEWVHVAAVFTANRRRCPVCSKVHTLDIDDKDDMYICCSEEEGGFNVGTMHKLVSARIYFGNADSFDFENAMAASSGSNKNDLSGTYYIDVEFPEATQIDWIRYGFITALTNIGSSFLVDNIKAYNGTDKLVPISDGNYGELVIESQAKTIEILSPDAEKTSLQYINEGLVMKVGSNYCLDTGVKRNIFEKDGVAYGAPVKIDGVVYIPLQAILDWIGYPMYQHDDNKSFDISTEKGSTFITVGRNTATANGKLIPLDSAPGYATDSVTGEGYLVVSVGDVAKLFEGYNVTYDEMGLVAISLSDKPVFDRATDIDMMLDLMKRFIYDYNTEEGYYNAVKANTNNFDHPYILANQDDFDYLNSAYIAEEGAEGYDARLKGYLEAVEKQAAAVYAEFANADPSANGKYLAAEIINPNIDAENNGYDGMIGRLEASSEYNEKLRTLALGYQITRNEDYAKLAYEFAVSMGKWEHWGPAYFINCADATAAYAMAYDWLYDIWGTLGYDLSVIENAIYKHGIVEGYRSSTGQECEHLSDMKDLSAYVGQKTGWNIVSTSGMVIGSLAVLGIDYLTAAESRYDMAYDDYVMTAKYLIKNNIENIMDTALELYAPDGSFEESLDYWSYATNALSVMSWALEDTVGTDMGIMTSCGIDNTFYQALQLEFPSYGDYLPEDFDYGVSSGLQTWNYHESLSGYLNTELFFYAAGAMDDDALAAVRLEQLEKKPVSIWDVLGYKKEYATLTADSVIGRTLIQVYDGLHAVTGRSDFEDGAIYTGIMGNRNDVANGQVDSGNFIYAAKNFTWFTDLGAEDDDVAGANDTAYRYNYYRNNAEGANTLVVYSDTALLPSGQLVDAGGVLDSYEVGENGFYAIIDNTDVYSTTVTSAYRGMLFTNARRTVVVQDEITFNNIRSYVWVSQTAAQEVIVSMDGRSAYLKQEVNGELCWIRATIVSDNAALRFETAKSTTGFYLPTHAANYSTKLGKAPERDRSMYQRLIIKGENQLKVNMAVVIEVIASEESGEIVEYEYTSLSDWDTEGVITDKFVSKVVVSTRVGNSNITDIKTYGDLAFVYADNGTAFSTRTQDFYYNMVHVAAAVHQFQASSMINTIKEVQQAYKTYKEVTLVKYNLFRDAVNETVDNNNQVAMYLAGYNYR